MSITAEQLEQKVLALANLPTLSAVVQKIAKLAEDRHTSAADIAEVISADQVLSAKVLRLVNSPVYGFPGRISTIKHALVLLGFNVIKGLVLSSAVFGSLAKSQSKGLWEHSVGCAVLSRRIARQLEYPDVEEFMVAGLLHDLGKVAMAHVAPREYAAALAAAQERGCHIAETEREFLGADHARVGGWLAERWCFPARLAGPLRLHHDPEQAESAASRDAVAVVHVADILARAMGYGSPGDVSMPPFSHDAFHSLRLPMAEVERLLQGVEAEFAAGAAVFGRED